MIDQDSHIAVSKIFTELRKGCKFKECLFPDKLNCSSKIVQAHSIQRNKILNKIAEEGIIMSYNALKSLFTGNLEEIGIKSASTFHGFCNYHDSFLFSPIENYNFTNTVEQGFIYAYRACAREYVMKYEVFNLIKKIMQKFPHLYESLMQVLIVEHLSSLDLVNILNRFHFEFQKPKKSSNFKIINTKVSRFPYESLIAVNSMFYILYDFNGKIINNLSDKSTIPSPTFFNVFPQDGETIVLLACFTDESNKFQNIYSQIKDFDQGKLEQFYSNLIITHCENFFLSPNKWNSQELSKQKEYVLRFKETMFNPPDTNYLSNIPPINLFKIFR